MRLVAAADVEPDEPAERTVEERIDRDAETHVPDDDGPADERAGPEERLHPAEACPAAPGPKPAQ